MEVEDISPPQLCRVHLSFILDQHPARQLLSRHLLLSPSGCGHINYLIFALLFAPPLVFPPPLLTLVVPSSLFPLTTCCLLLSTASRLIRLSSHHSLFLSILSLLVASRLHHVVLSWAGRTLIFGVCQISNSQWQRWGDL